MSTVIARSTARVTRVDWCGVVIDLERAGYSQRQIGGECDADASWVNRLKNIPGTQPKFHSGALLLGLWATVMEREPSMAPSTGVWVSAAGVR